ncbi:hypothetical protein [Microbacterium alcoholitolerans]|uniref:hypothetical protein n=1 Tax=unclassified Microbacterium TaxID=2609290 RepID=UPI003D1799D4
MSDAQKVQGEAALAEFPGLSLLGDDTAMGVCADGVCTVPTNHHADPVQSKRD